MARPLRRDQRDFEAELTAQGVTIVKCMLHISPQEQAERLLARLDEPAKRWKYNPGDVDVRARWADYRAPTPTRCARPTPTPPPGTSIPADRKWYRNWAIAALLAETLEELAPQFPAVLRRRRRAGPRQGEPGHVTSGWITPKASAAIGIVST